jgi:hypothetical protein
MMLGYDHAVVTDVKQACNIELPKVVSGEDVRNWLFLACEGNEFAFRKAAFVLADAFFSYLWGKMANKNDDEGMFLACMVSQAMDGTPSRLVEIMEGALENAALRFKTREDFVDFVMALFARWAHNSHSKKLDLAA